LLFFKSNFHFKCHLKNDQLLHILRGITEEKEDKNHIIPSKGNVQIDVSIIATRFMRIYVLGVSSVLMLIYFLTESMDPLVFLGLTGFFFLIIKINLLFGEYKLKKIFKKICNN